MHHTMQNVQTCVHCPHKQCVFFFAQVYTFLHASVFAVNLRRRYRYALVWIDRCAVKCYQTTADEIKRCISAYDTHTHTSAVRYNT